MKKTAHKVYTERSRSGFTLVELLVVIAIIAILAAVVYLILNPIEIMKQGRDSARLIDLANLQNAINVAVQESSASSQVDVLCVGTGTYPCSGKSTDIDGRDADGSGWVKIDLSSSNTVSVPTLPADPLNTSTHHYTYCANNDVYELATTLESEKQISKMLNDGGDEGDLYEVGSNLNVITEGGSLCAY